MKCLNHLTASAVSLTLSSFACASVFNTHLGISVGSNNQLVTEGWISGSGYQGPNQVFAFDAQSLGGSSFFDIGTNSIGGTFAYPGDIGFNYMDALALWNGNGFDDANTTLTMQFQLDTATSGSGFTPGLGTPVRDPSTHPNNPEQWGRHHNHFDFFINNDPADGIYLMEFTLWYEPGAGNPVAHAGSKSFWVLFNLHGDETDVAIARDWVQQNLVPAPGVLALLALAAVARAPGRRRASTTSRSSKAC